MTLQKTMRRLFAVLLSAIFTLTCMLLSILPSLYTINAHRTETAIRDSLKLYPNAKFLFEDT